MTPLEKVLSGQFELCIPRVSSEMNAQADFSRAFIRNAQFKTSDGNWTDVVSMPISSDEAMEIQSHECVVAGLQGSLLHYHTRSWPVNQHHDNKKVNHAI